MSEDKDKEVVGIALTGVSADDENRTIRFLVAPPMTEDKEQFGELTEGIAIKGETIPALTPDEFYSVLYGDVWASPETLKHHGLLMAQLLATVLAYRDALKPFAEDGAMLRDGLGWLKNPEGGSTFQTSFKERHLVAAAELYYGKKETESSETPLEPRMVWAKNKEK